MERLICMLPGILTVGSVGVWAISATVMNSDCVPMHIIIDLYGLNILCGYMFCFGIGFIPIAIIVNASDRWVRKMRDGQHLEASTNDE